MHVGDDKLPHKGEYFEINRPDKLVFTWGSHSSADNSTVTLNFTKIEDNKTNISLSHVTFIIDKGEYTMKTMTCKQLGGACDQEFQANSFEEIAEISKKHGMEMFQKSDEPHLSAMNEMQDLMKSPDAMNEWMEIKRKEFDALPENE